MKRFKSIRHAQRFLSAFSGISPHFRPRRHLLSAADDRQVMAEGFAVLNEITGATTTPAAGIGDEFPITLDKLLPALQDMLGTL